MAGVGVVRQQVVSNLLQSSTGSIWIFGYGSLVHRPGFEHARRVEGYIKGWRRVWWQGSTDHRGTPEFPGRTVTLERCDEAITWGAAYELAGDTKQQEETLKYLEWREKQYDIREFADVWGTEQQAGAASLGGEPPLAFDPAAGPLVGACSTTEAPLESRGVTASGDAPALAAPGQQGQLQAEARPSQAGSSSATSITSSSPGPGAPSSSSTVPGTRVLLRNVLVYIASPDKSRNANYLGPASVEELAQQIARASGPSGPNWEYVSRLADSMRDMGVEDPELVALHKRVQEVMAELSAAAEDGSCGGKMVQSGGPVVVQVGVDARGN